MKRSVPEAYLEAALGRGDYSFPFSPDLPFRFGEHLPHQRGHELRPLCRPLLRYRVRVEQLAKEPSEGEVTE